LLQQLYQSRYGHLPSVSDLEAWLKAGADTITDRVTGISLGRLNIEKAAGLVPEPKPQVIVQEPPPVPDSVEEAPPPDIREEVPAGPQQQTELFVNGESAGRFDGDDLSATLQRLFPETIISLTDLRVWDQQSGSPGADSKVKLDRLLVWDNTAAEQKTPGQSQAAGKVGKARDLPHPRVLAWRGLTGRRRVQVSFVPKDSQS
jgi:hypothetical protein